MGTVYEGPLVATGLRFAIVVARFNAFITESLLAGARDGLRRHGAALCWADRLGRPIAPRWRTAPWGYLRLHEGTATPRPSYGRNALGSWLDRIDEVWPGARRADVFVYFNNDPGGAAVRNARSLRTMAGNRSFTVR